MRLLSESDLKRVEYDVGFREVPADRSASGKRAEAAGPLTPTSRTSQHGIQGLVSASAGAVHRTLRLKSGSQDINQ